MMSAVTTHRTRVLAGLLALTTALAACSSTTDGAGQASNSPSASSTPIATPSANVPSTPAASTPPSPATSEATPSTHPVPAAPLRTATVHADHGVTYIVKIWADVSDPTCYDHAYGQPMITFLTQHPCRGLDRFLGSTTVGGRPVGFAEAITSFPGTPKDPYVNSGAFRTLVEQDGTGNINDLLREGYRLPSGPSAVPSPDAFNVVGQDNGVTVWDVWYLDGPTPNNDKALVQMTMDIFLQF
jgi:hypothetical protein